MRKRFQRMMAWLLAVLMTVTYLPTDTWADVQHVQDKAGESTTSQEENKKDAGVEETAAKTMSNEQGKVNSLEIITMPYRTSYYCNCDFIERYVSMRGLELLVTYSDGNTETLSAEYTENPQDSYGNTLYWDQDSQWLETPGEYEILLTLGDASINVPITTREVSDAAVLFSEQETDLTFEKDIDGNWCAVAMIEPSETGTYTLQKNFSGDMMEMYSTEGVLIDKSWSEKSNWKLEAGTSYICYFRNTDYIEGGTYQASVQKTVGVQKVEITRQPYNTQYVQELDRNFFYSADGIGLKVTYDNGDVTTIGYADDGSYTYEDKYGNYFYESWGDLYWSDIISTPGDYNMDIIVDGVKAEEGVRVQVLPMDAVSQVGLDNDFSIDMSENIKKWIKFVPEKSGQHNLSVSAWMDAYVLDENFEQIGYMNGTGLSVNMEAERTYYILFRSSDAGSYTGCIREVPRVIKLTMLQEPIKKNYVKNLDYTYYLDGLELELSYENGSSHILSWDDIGEYGEWIDSFGNKLQVDILKDGNENNYDWNTVAGIYQMILSVQEQSVSLEFTVEDINNENVPVLIDTDQEFYYNKAGNTFIQFTPKEDGTYAFQFNREMDLRKYNLETGGYDSFYGKQINLVLDGGIPCYFEISKDNENTSFIGRVEKIPELKNVEIISGPNTTEYLLEWTDTEINMNGLAFRLTYGNGETTFIEYGKYEKEIDKYGTQALYMGLKNVDGDVQKPGAYLAEIEIGTIVKEVEIQIKSISDINTIELEIGKTLEGKANMGYEYFSFTAPETKDYHFKMDNGRNIYWKEKEGGELQSIWTNSTVFKMEKGKSYIFAVDFQEEGTYEICVNSIPEIQSIEIKELPRIKYYYGLENYLEDYELKYQVLYENGEKETLSRNEITKYGMELLVESPFDEEGLRDEEGHLPTGDYEVVYKLGTANIVMKISVLPLDTLEQLIEEENQFLSGYQIFRFTPEETGSYHLKLQEAADITVYDSEYKLYFEKSYCQDAVIDSMLKGKTYYFLLRKGYGGNSEILVTIEKDKTVVKVEADTSDLPTAYRQCQDNVSFDDLYINVEYNDGTKETIHSYDFESRVSIDFESTGMPLEKTGIYPVTVSYKGLSDTFYIECVSSNTGDLQLLEEENTNIIPFNNEKKRQTVRFIPSQTAQYVFHTKFRYGDESIQIWDNNGVCIAERLEGIDTGLVVSLEKGKEYLIGLTAGYRDSITLGVTRISKNIKSMQFQKSSIKDYYLYENWAPSSEEFDIAVEVEYEDGKKDILKNGEQGRYGASMVVTPRKDGEKDNVIIAEYLGKTITGTLNLCNLDEAPLQEVFFGENTLEVDRNVITFKFTPDVDGIYYYDISYGDTTGTAQFMGEYGDTKKELKKGHTYYLIHYIVPGTKSVGITVNKVKEVEKIEIKTKPEKTVYVSDYDYSVDSFGLVIHVTYTDGTDRDIALKDFNFEGFTIQYPNIGYDLDNVEPGNYKGIVSWKNVSASFDIKILSMKEAAETVKVNETKSYEKQGRKVYGFTPEKDGYYWYTSDAYTVAKNEAGHEITPIYSMQIGFKKLIYMEKGNTYFFTVNADETSGQFCIQPQKAVTDIQVKNNTVTVIANTSLYNIEQKAEIVYEDGTKDRIDFGESLETGGSLEMISLYSTSIKGSHPAVLKFLNKKVDCNLNVVSAKEYEMREMQPGTSQKLEQGWEFFKFRTSDKPYYRFVTDSKESIRLQFYSNEYFNSNKSSLEYTVEDASALVKLMPNTTYYLSVYGKPGSTVEIQAISGIEKIQVMNKGQEELFVGEAIEQSIIEEYYYAAQLKITDTDGNSWTEIYNPYISGGAISVGLEQQAGAENAGECKAWVEYCDKKIIETIPIVKIQESKNLIDLGDGGKSQFKRNQTRWKQVFKITPNMTGAFKININTMESVWNTAIKLVDENGETLIDTYRNIGSVYPMEAPLVKGKSYYLVLMSYPLLTGEQMAAVEVMPKAVFVPVKELKLNTSQINFAKPGETKQLTASVTPANATNKTIIWTSSDEAVAKVTGGKVTAAGPGTCVITASAGGVTASCKVTVKAPAEKISLNKTSATIYTGKTYTLTPELTPSNSTDTVTWSSSNTKVAKVSSKGVVTGVAKGTATITAKTTSGKTAVCKVTVKTAATKVTLSKTSVTVNKGKTYTLKATMSPSDTNDSLQWSSSNSKVAKVSASGVVTGVAKGSATITVKTGSGKTAVCKVTVKIPSTKVSLNKTSISVNKGKTYSLKGTLSPSDSTDSLKWSSSNTKIAKVSSSGIVTGIEKGSATITVKATSGKTASCKVTVKIPSAKVTMSKTSVSVNVGKTYTLKGTMSPSNTTDTLKWTSSDTKIAKVSSAGVVTAVAKGNATITAKTTSGKTATCKVTVKVPSTKVTMNKTSVSVIVGKTYTLKGTMSPSNTTDIMKWSSSNTKVAKVSSAGVVTALAKGSATITVKTTSGKTATCKVTVKVPSTKVAMSKTSVSINVGKTYTLKGTMSPGNTTDTLKWSSSNTKIAKVSSAGVVTAVAKGSATITVKTTSGKAATCKVTVKVPSTKVAMNKTSASINVGKTYTLKGTMSPSNTTDTMKWSSSNTKIAKVSSAGVVTAVAKGTATITVKTTSGKSATCKVTVKVPSTKVSVSKTSVSINKGKTYTLKGTMSPGNTTDTLKWSSSNTKVAKVSSSGVVTAVEKGTATITVKATSGKSATCKVTVKIPSTKVALGKASISIYKGKTYTLKGTLTPGNSTDTLKWSSSNTKSASVSSSGVVKGISAGTSTITVKTSSGKTATCKVTVKEIKATSVKFESGEINLISGQSVKVGITVLPANTTDDITWSSSDESIVRVSSDGTISAGKEGEAFIEAKASGGKKSSCKVIVSASTEGVEE